MPKRDYIAEITSIRSRLLPETGRWKQLIGRMSDIHTIRGHIDGLDPSSTFRSEIAKYLPIGYVACIEGFVRIVAKDLIDRNKTFRQNVTAFKDLRFEAVHAVAMQGGTFTLGDFVSHQIPTNNLTEISYSLSTILGESFLDRVKNTEWIHEGKTNTWVTLDLADDIIRSVTRLFELRHIFAHELGTSLPVDIKEISMCTSHASMFLSTTAILAKLLVGD